MSMPLFYKQIRWRRPEKKAEDKSPPSAFIEQIKGHWDLPDALYADVLEAMEHEYMTVALNVAARLLSIDRQPERSFILHSRVLQRLNRLDEAELVLHQYITQFGLSASVLAQLGNIQMAREHWPYAAELLWQALELDPNHPEALAWWESVHVEQSGDQAAEHALKQAASLPGAWRALARLAVLAFRSGESAHATELWQKSLAAAPPDGSAWSLVSGELASCGGIEMLLPEYDPVVHGVPAGLQLLAVLRDQGRIADAQLLLQQIAPYDTPETRRELAKYALELARSTPLPSSEQGRSQHQ